MNQRLLKALKLTSSCVLIACVAGFIVLSWNWPFVGDAPLIHYVIFLSHHGYVPYKNIIDLNLPGTLAVEAAVMLLGQSALTWRLFDLAVLVEITVAMVIVCGPRRRYAALFASAIFVLIHGRDGLIQLGQRDLVMGAMLLTGYAFLARVYRAPQKRPALAFFWTGLCFGAACTIKPDALLLPILLILPLQHFLRQHVAPVLSTFAFLGLGVLLPPLASLAYLHYIHAVGPFLGLMLHLAPYHSGIWRLASLNLIKGSVSSVLLPLFVAWLAVFLGDRRWQRPMDQLLLLGFLFGVFSFYLQGRGYPYHRYPSELFLLLLAGLAFQERLLHTAPSGRPHFGLELCLRWVAVAGLVFGTFVVAPRSLAELARFSKGSSEFNTMLTADLNALGGRALDGKVQCLEMAGGCISTLYDQRLVQSTGFFYDCYLYPEKDQSQRYIAERDRYRNAFRAALQAKPPKVLIVSSDECGPPDFSYRKLDRWSWLSGYLSRNYHLALDRRPTRLEDWGPKPALPDGYRIYMQNQTK